MRRKASQKKTLGDYYREHGESEQLLTLEGALDEEWQHVPDLVDGTELSASFIYKALHYLEDEGRAESERRTRRTGKVTINPKLSKRQTIHYYRLPQ